MDRTSDLVWPRLIVSGHAKLPQEAAARAVYEILTIVAAVDPATSEIVDVDCTLITQTARDFVRRLLIGELLNESPDALLDVVHDNYWGGAKKALAAAVRDLYTNWAEMRRA